MTKDMPPAAADKRSGTDSPVKFIMELFPMAVFLGCYFLSPRAEAMYIAIIGTTAAMFITTATHRLLYGKFNPMHLVTLLLLVLFGGSSLLLRSKIYFLWKPTVLYWLFASILGGSNLLGRPLLPVLMKKHVSLTAQMWYRMTWVWAAFCLFLGAINLLVAYNFSEEFWVTFKVFGFMTLTFLFMLAQMPLLLKGAARHEQVDEPETGESGAR